MIAAFIQTLQKHLQEKLEPILLAGQSDGSDVQRAPSVFIGDLPPKKGPKGKGEEHSSIPAVVLVPLSGHQEKGEYVQEVALICIVYNREDGDITGGEVDLSILISAIFGSLTPCAFGEPLNRRYQLEQDSRGRLLPWEKYREQPKPFIQATILSQWRFKGWQ